ncbi:hypothetical protein L2E82_19267 [Cichorium intybus]|uniref:Uncharacterized protein n=1 Tax=Cichorium intybus TaxID=13427 RepID=A0ACB9FCA9_CICIN|nr:hypothetical protein L2E82_19267 [Cichorium intybus]
MTEGDNPNTDLAIQLANRVKIFQLQNPKLPQSIAMGLLTGSVPWQGEILTGKNGGERGKASAAAGNSSATNRPTSSTHISDSHRNHQLRPTSQPLRSEVFNRANGDDGVNNAAPNGGGNQANDTAPNGGGNQAGDHGVNNVAPNGGGNQAVNNAAPNGGGDKATIKKTAGDGAGGADAGSREETREERSRSDFFDVAGNSSAPIFRGANSSAVNGTISGDGSSSIGNGSSKSIVSSGCSFSSGKKGEGFDADKGNEGFSNFNPKSRKIDFDPEKEEMAEITPEVYSFISYINKGLKNCRNDQRNGGNANIIFSGDNLRDKTWILDSGATDTMTYEISDLISLSKPRKAQIQTANGEKMEVKQGGTIEFSPMLKLSNCLYVPSLSQNLLSISHVTKELNCSVLMHPTFCILQDIRTGAIIGRGTEKQGLYYVDEVTQNGTVMMAHGTTEREAWLWHRRLGHPSTGYLHTLFPNLFPSKNLSLCETCVLAKSHRQTFKPNKTRVDVPFSLIHSDVWGPSPIIGGQNLRFFVLFIDDCTRMTWMYFLKNKSEVLDKFIMFHTMIQTQFQKNIQIFRSDNGGEFVNTSMKQFFQSKGIIHQTSCPHTPEQNGVAERKNRFLLEITRALLIESKVPKSFWPEALATATYLINRLPTNILKFKTPLQTLSEFVKIPSFLMLEPKIFGCTTFVHIPKSQRNKLDPCAEKCVFVGYGVNQKGYRCYNPKTHHMFTTMNCDFLETEYYYASQHSGQGEIESSDTLSWLEYVQATSEENIHSTQESPNETAQKTSHNISTQYTNPNSSAIPDQSPNLTSEVCNTQSPHTHDSPEHVDLVTSDHETATEQEEQLDIREQEELIQEQPTGRYMLPPRTNRGIPPKRYSPERESRGSRYPMANMAKGNLTQEAKAFNAALYSEETPTSIDQALKMKNWKDAMENEMKALLKNDTWEKCVIPI